MLNINLKDYEILKIISEQLRILAWAVGAVFGYMLLKIGLIVAVLYAVMHWLICQVCEIYVLSLAQRYIEV